MLKHLLEKNNQMTNTHVAVGFDAKLDLLPDAMRSNGKRGRNHLRITRKCN